MSAFFLLLYEDWIFILTRPDMFVLGFQEIVPLTAQQIVQTDPEKRSASTPDIVFLLTN